MKWNSTNIIAAIGFFLLFLLFAAGLTVGILFIFPKIKLFGTVTAVNERDTQIVYKDDDLRSAFAQGNFIIESTNCNVEVVMPVSGQAGEGTVVVNESATGVAFNSFSRTLIEWTETLVGKDKYFKIKILEPTGVVFTKVPTTVYLNLTNDEAIKYNFILRNNNSNVNFSFGDKEAAAINQFKIDSLVVQSAASVTLPSNDFLRVTNVALQSNYTKFSCGALVAQNVTVTGDYGTQSFAKIMGDVTLDGYSNNFRADTVGAVVDNDLSGSFSANYADSLQVRTSIGNISVHTVRDGVKMVTDKGHLNVNNIQKGGLDFEATTSAGVSVGQSLVGNVSIINHGVGNIDLNGVRGHVNIVSKEINGGTIAVKYDQEDVTPYSTNILGYDGNIAVENIHGKTDIQIWLPGSSGAAGRANIFASFNRITNEDNILRTGAYVNSPNNIGNITVRLNSGWNDFDLVLEAARSAWFGTTELKNDQVTEIINQDIGTNDSESDSGVVVRPAQNKGKLIVSTPADLRLQK